MRIGRKWRERWREGAKETDRHEPRQDFHLREWQVDFAGCTDPRKGNNRVRERLHRAYRVAHNLPNAETVDASACTGLTALPDLPNAKIVEARGCTGLTALPDLPNVEFVEAYGCTGLAALPDLPNAEFVNASGCTEITALPDLPNAKTVEASGCTGLTALPDLPNPTGDYISGGVDSRGYLFEGTSFFDQWRVTVGSRSFSIVDARLHWGPGGPVDLPDCLALVEKIGAEIERSCYISPTIRSHCRRVMIARGAAIASARGGRYPVAERRP
jgi:hypothetical protein